MNYKELYISMELNITIWLKSCKMYPNNIYIFNLKYILQ